jgi:uncharacterized protein (DUF2267 family)
MDEKQIFRAVAERATLSVEEAADLTRATLTALAYRVSSGEARHLAATLPEPLREYLPVQERISRFGIDEFLRRIKDRTGLNQEETERGVQAVLSTLHQAVDGQVFTRVMAQLPAAFRTMAVAAPATTT